MTPTQKILNKVITAIEVNLPIKRDSNLKTRKRESRKHKQLKNSFFAHKIAGTTLFEEQVARWASSAKPMKTQIGISIGLI